MKSVIKMNVFLVIVVTLLSASWANAAGTGNNIVVVLAGIGQAYAGNDQFEQFDLPPLDATCFDMDLVDAKTGNVIGRGSDCLSDVAESGDGGGSMLTATTFFYFPGGTLVSRGRVTVQPVLTGSTEFTHITGAVPSAYDNNVIYGDGKFKKAYGSVRLSGAVNLTDLPTKGLAVFDCVFVIDV
jgi:hypothetical protein